MGDHFIKTYSTHLADWLCKTQRNLFFANCIMQKTIKGQHTIGCQLCDASKIIIYYQLFIKISETGTLIAI